MLFNSYSFILVFLPITFWCMFWLGQRSHYLAALWLGCASLAFYALWDARFLILLLASIVFNYGASHWIVRRKLAMLIVAIAANLTLLAYFKYANFFISSSNQFLDSHWAALNIVLPLGISFFTFTQIAFLVDVYRGIARETNFSHYLLFVTYFPHLIAGPVLHHKQMMPQFKLASTYRINPEHVAVGLTIFTLGLAKKVLIADSLAPYANQVFDAARDGQILMLFEAWIGALAYTLQLYFDFSAYSDMAIGLSLLFNIRLPMNFDSPYKATNIIDFWQRWHITLSTFLRDYLYIPLGGNRRGVMRRYGNLMTTMLLGGLWHGAGLTFVIWGGLHGLYLMVNHGWRELKKHFGWMSSGLAANLLGGLLTFLSVVVAWVFFRSENLTTATSMLVSMAGWNGVSFPAKWASSHVISALATFIHLDLRFEGTAPILQSNARCALGRITLGLGLIWLFPNVRQIMRHYKTTWNDIAGESAPITTSGIIAQKLVWRPSAMQACLVGSLFFYCVFSMNKISEFLYFQF